MSILTSLIKVLSVSSLWNGAGSIYHNGNDSAPCESPLYCYGQILTDIQLARPFADSKTFVDMPTRVSLEEVQRGYEQLQKPLRNDSQLLNFLSEYFAPAGTELVPMTDANLTTNATFLRSMKNPVNREFVQQIVGRWSNLTRIFNRSAICDSCQSSFIPIRRPFVIAGGRFREPYHWDSYWILQGLLRTGGSFTEISRNQIENFFDDIENFGFVPNGARKYYLNRSQPPVLPQMVRIYLEFTGDSSILERGLPLLMREHNFFETNRSVSVAINNKIFTLQRYNVDNTQPRPESFCEDWEQVNNLTFYAANGHLIPARNLSQHEKKFQYKNLASAAESGWDFSSRFLRNPWAAAATNGTYLFPLASLNIVNIIPVDLNALLYWNEVTIASFLRRTGNISEATRWEGKALRRSEAMYALMWDSQFGTYLDYNLTSGSTERFTARDADALPVETRPASFPPDTPPPQQQQQRTFNVAQLLPFLTGAAAPSIKNDPAAVRRAFGRVSDYLDTREGGIAATNYRTNQQWDQQNVWPPLMQMLMEALLKTPATNGEEDEDWLWTQDLALRLGQRYLDSAYCTWRATGGETPASPKLGGLNTSNDVGGLMFEKYSDASLNEAGGGGEYQVVVGFGWSNGVLIWVADTFCNRLQTPPCTGEQWHSDSKKRIPYGSRKSAVQLDPWDAWWTDRGVGGLA